jgi:hypothetical protein
MEWNDLEQDAPTPSIRSLLYDRGGILFADDATFSERDDPADEWSEDLLDDE